MLKINSNFGTDKVINFCRKITVCPGSRLHRTVFAPVRPVRRFLQKWTVRTVRTIWTVRTVRCSHNLAFARLFAVRWTLPGRQIETYRLDRNLPLHQKVTVLQVIFFIQTVTFSLIRWPYTYSIFFYYKGNFLPETVIFYLKNGKFISKRLLS